MYDIRLKFGTALFKQGDYEAAMQELQQSGAHPRQILAMFPNVMPSAPPQALLGHLASIGASTSAVAAVDRIPDHQLLPVRALDESSFIL
jgi:hypothetical protein